MSSHLSKVTKQGMDRQIGNFPFLPGNLWEPDRHTSQDAGQLILAVTLCFGGVQSRLCFVFLVHVLICGCVCVCACTHVFTCSHSLSHKSRNLLRAGAIFLLYYSWGKKRKWSLNTIGCGLFYFLFLNNWSSKISSSTQKVIAVEKNFRFSAHTVSWNEC